jgi:hypothetical protein
MMAFEDDIYFPDQFDPAPDPGPVTDLPAQWPLRRCLLDLLHRPAGGCAG